MGGAFIDIPKELLPPSVETEIAPPPAGPVPLAGGAAVPLPPRNPQR
jgi:hypothetical protein